MADKLMRLPGVGPDNETDRERRLRLEEFLRAMNEKRDWADLRRPSPQEPDDLPPLPGIVQPPLRPAPELGEFDEPVVVPDAPEVAETVGGETPVDDVLSWLEMTPEQKGAEDSMRAFSEGKRDAAARAAESLRRKNEARKVLREEAAKKNPSPSTLERALVVLTGGISGHFGTFDKAQRSRAARADVDKSFETEWKRIQDAAGAEKSARLSSELIGGRARTKAKFDGAIDAVKAMAGMGLTSPQPWVFEGFEPSLATEIGDAFKTAAMTFNAIGTPKERQVAQLAHIDSLGKLAYFQTWANDPPKAVLPNWQPQVNEAFANARANAEANQLAAAEGRAAVRTEEQSRYEGLLSDRLARVFKLTPSNEVGTEFDGLMNSYANRVTSATSGEALLRELDETEGVQLLMLHALRSELVSDKEKEDLKRFIAEDGDPDKKGWRPAKTFTNLAALKARLKDIGFNPGDVDQMQFNMDRITRLRDELEEAKRNHPPVDGVRSKEVSNALERLALANSLTFSNWKMRKVEGPDGEITYDSVETKPKPYSIRTIPHANGIAISYVVDPEFRKNASPQELEDMEANAKAEIKRFVSEGDNVTWSPTLGPQGGEGIGDTARKKAQDHMDSLEGEPLQKTIEAMKRYKVVEGNLSKLTEEEKDLLFPLTPLLD